MFSIHPKESNRDRLCGIIDTILAEKPEDYEDFLQKLEQQGFEVKRGKNTLPSRAKGRSGSSVSKRWALGTVRMKIKAVLEENRSTSRTRKNSPKSRPSVAGGHSGKMAEGKSVGYARWAKKYSLKEMSKTLLFLQEQKISSADELRERTAAATERYHASWAIPSRPPKHGWPKSPC